MGGGFLLFVVVIILSIASSNSKKRKSTQQEAEIPPIFNGEESMFPDNEGSFEDLFGELEKGESIEEVFDEMLKRVEPTPNSEPATKPVIKSVPAPEWEVVPSMPCGESKSEMRCKQVVPTTISRKSKSDKKTQNSERNEDCARISKSQGDNKGVVPEEFLAEFDMRKAIIYSEILSPKYKEY